MSKSICTAVRRQLDEMDLHEVHGTEISQHLGNCPECSDFHQKQASLRQLVGSLGTVSAPADFDFRLRARLASDKGNSVHFLSIANWSIFQRSAAIATALALVIGAAVLVRQFKDRNQAKPGIMKAGTPASGPQVPQSAPQSPPQTRAPEKVVTAQKNDGVRERPRKQMPAAAPRNTRTLMAKELANERAPLYGAQKEDPGTVFPIDAAQQSLRVSLFDGRGNPRTISLPGVTFGSQKVVPSTTSYAPKGVW